MVSDVLGYPRHPAFSRVLPFAVFIAFIAASGLLERLATAIGMDARWWYAIRTLIVAGLLAWFWRGYVELKSAAGVRVLDWLLAVALGVVVFVLWINLDFKPLAFGGSSGFDPRGEAGAIDWLFVVPRLAGAALLVPVMEELFWRSFAMRWIQDHDFLKVPPARVGLKALGISAVLFALEHHLWFAGLLAGLAYGWLYIRTGNLWVPILSHAVTNCLLGAWILYTQSWEFW
jgi:CAAX prenyl protease-like protein